MVKSKIIQIILLCFGLLIFIFTYLSFFQKTNSNYFNETERLEKSLEQSLDMKKIVKKDKDNDSVIEEGKNTSNIISDLSYINVDDIGIIFNISSIITKSGNIKIGTPLGTKNPRKPIPCFIKPIIVTPMNISISSPNVTAM